jgi:hypothetical protein
MAYLGEIPYPPNHPFAHSQISFGMKRPSNSSSASETPKAEESSTKPPAADSIPKDEQQAQ